MTFRVRNWTAVLVAALLSSALPASAQVISAPPRAASVQRPAAGTRHQASVTANVLGGYDQDQAQQLAGPNESLDTDGYNSFSDLALRYAFTSGPSTVSAVGRGYANTFPGSNIENGYGGDLNLQSQFLFGRTQLTGVGNLRYEPFYSLGALGALNPGLGSAEFPDASPVNALPNEQTLNMDGSLGLTRLWTSRHGSSATYSVLQRNRQGDIGLDLTDSNAQLSHTYSASRRLDLGVAYIYSRTQFQLRDSSQGAGAMNTQSLQFQLTRTFRVSPNRSIVLGGAAGGDHVEGDLDVTGQDVVGQRYQYWAPIARATLQVDVGRNWTMATDYNRAVLPLDGLSGQSFPSNVVSLRAGGPLFGRLSTAVAVSYAAGNAGAEDVNQEFETYAATGQLSYALTRRWSSVFNVNWYSYEVVGGNLDATNLPPSFERASVRAGLSVALPLTSASRDTPGGRPGR